MIAVALQGGGHGHDAGATELLGLPKRRPAPEGKPCRNDGVREHLDQGTGEDEVLFDEAFVGPGSPIPPGGDVGARDYRSGSTRSLSMSFQRPLVGAPFGAASGRSRVTEPFEVGVRERAGNGGSSV